MQLGGYLPFSWREFAAGLNDMTGWTAGLDLLRDWVAPGALAATALWIGARPPKWLGGRARLYAILILGVPLGVALVQSGNSGFARYYLSSALGLLFLGAEWIARGLGKPPAVRAAAAALLAVLTLTGLWRDSELIALQRGQPDGAVAVMAGRDPLGARVALEPKRLEGALTVAARSARFPVRIVKGCAPADYRARRAAAPGSHAGGDRPLRKTHARGRLVDHQLAHRRSLGAVRRGKLANRGGPC